MAITLEANMQLSPEVEAYIRLREEGGTLKKRRISAVARCLCKQKDRFVDASKWAQVMNKYEERAEELLECADRALTNGTGGLPE